MQRLTGPTEPKLEATPASPATVAEPVNVDDNPEGEGDYAGEEEIPEDKKCTLEHDPKSWHNPQELEQSD